jgi:hypothetical protein
MAPEHILVPYLAHRFIVNVHPSIPATSVSVPVKDIHRIVPASRRLAVVIEDSIEHVVCRLCRWSGGGYHDI